MRIYNSIRSTLLITGLGLAFSPFVFAQQVIVLDQTGPVVTLGVPQSIEPGTRAASNSASQVEIVYGNAPLRGISLPTAQELLVPRLGNAARVSQPKSVLTSDKRSLAELALPPELGGASSLPSSDQAKTSDQAIESIPKPAAEPRTSSPSFDPLLALPTELNPIPSTEPQAKNRPSAERPSMDASPPAARADTQVENRFKDSKATGDAKSKASPYFYCEPSGSLPPGFNGESRLVPYTSDAFLPQPISTIPTPLSWESSAYRGKQAVPTQRPLIELGRPLYSGGVYPPAKTWFGPYNLAMPHFMVYGDFRTGVGINRNANGDANNWASRLNLDMDLEITATERIHAFMGPLDRAGDFTRLDFTNQADFVDRTDIRFDNLFFEGDLGAILGGMNDQDALFDLPFTFGFLPVFYQNGIWAADNVIGAAVAVPAKNSPLLKWSNYDATFFWASDQVNTDAFPADNNAAEFFGTAWFIEAYDGYIEADYAFVHDDVGGHRSYHNLSVAFTRRYFHRLSNSIRYITNFGQSLPSDQRTADGHLLLIENSLISAAPNTFVPYLNFFYGQGRTQSLARAAVAGGILNNTGISFETDALTGYPTLDATGVNATGAAVGVNMLGADFSHQLILELAALSANGSAQFRNASGDEFAAGMRYQKPLSNAWIFRTDHMFGWRQNASDLRGSRVELRWKF